MLCRNILTDLSVINYVPFDSDTIRNPALDVGDVLRFAGDRRMRADYLYYVHPAENRGKAETEMRG